MLYPGQIVYIPKEKKVGIYLAFKPSNKSTQPPDMYVWTYIGEKGELSDHVIFAPKELVPVTEPVNTYLTGTKLYESPFQRDSFLNFYLDTELPELEAKLNPELEKVMKKKWFRDKYEIDLTK